jgi:hypothetical protein
VRLAGREFAVGVISKTIYACQPWFSRTWSKGSNNQDGLIAVSNAAGQVLSRNYDIDDRVVNAVDLSTL